MKNKGRDYLPLYKSVKILIHKIKKMQDFLDKLDAELDNMQPKSDAVKKVEENKVVIKSISNKKDEKSDLEKRIEEKIKKYSNKSKNSS
jgi:flagellar biosynthesis chaperone FliJ